VDKIVILMKKQRLIIGITGASGIQYGIRMLELLRSTDIETHFVISQAGKIALRLETDQSLSDVQSLAHVSYKINDIAAPIASGSFETLGMIVAPCSISSLSQIATGVTTNLLTRAADVVLKERRRLVLMVRETPLHTGHLRTMVQASEIGAIIAPPMPAFYAEPESINDLVEQTVSRTLDLFDIQTPTVKRWGEELRGGKRRQKSSPRSVKIKP